MKPGDFGSGEANPRYRPAIERFAERCRFDPATGCVLWIGGMTAGRGSQKAQYGRFWYDGFNWLAHRWAAVYIHGIELGDNQGGHVCPHGPNTRCVQHIAAQSQLENLAEQNDRRKARQSNRTKQFWLFVSLGIEPPPATVEVDPGAVPFYDPPEWLLPFLPVRETFDDAPF